MRISDFNRFWLITTIIFSSLRSFLPESEQATNIKVKIARILTNFKSIVFHTYTPYYVIYFENDDFQRLN